MDNQKVIVTGFSNQTNEGIVLHTNIPASYNGGLKSKETWLSWDAIGAAVFGNYTDAIGVPERNALRKAAEPSRSEAEGQSVDESSVNRAVNKMLKRLDEQLVTIPSPEAVVPAEPANFDVWCDELGEGWGTTFQIGHQSFSVYPGCKTRQEAEWMANNLRTALNRIAAPQVEKLVEALTQKSKHYLDMQSKPTDVDRAYYEGAETATDEAIRIVSEWAALYPNSINK